MNILAIDTATEYCSAALSIDGDIIETGKEMARGHSDYILSMVEQVLADSGMTLNECDAIAFDKGPGSFTGIRIGAGVAQGLAFGKDLPVVPVSSLHALALQCDGDYIAAAIDARMQQIYSACFKRTGQNQFQSLTSETVMQPDAVSLEQNRNWTAIGSGWDRYGETIKNKFPGIEIDVVSGRYPHAKDIALIAAGVVADGGAIEPEFGFPEYIRDKVTN